MKRNIPCTCFMKYIERTNERCLASTPRMSKRVYMHTHTHTHIEWNNGYMAWLPSTPIPSHTCTVDEMDGCAWLACTHRCVRACVCVRVQRCTAHLTLPLSANREASSSSFDAIFTGVGVCVCVCVGTGKIVLEAIFRETSRDFCRNTIAHTIHCVQIELNNISKKKKHDEISNVAHVFALLFIYFAPKITKINRLTKCG